MTTFADGESGANVRNKINAAISAVDSLGSGDNLLMTAAERVIVASLSANFAALSHTHSAAQTVSGTFSDARISQSSVTQHQNALTITESQISNLKSYSTAINVENNATADQTGPEIVAAIDADLGSSDWQGGGGGGIASLAGDTTPQLGGPLDTNGNAIVSVGANDIVFTPAAGQKIVFGGPVDIGAVIYDFNPQAGTAYTILATDALPLMMTSDSDNVVTFPTNATQPIAIGKSGMILSDGDGVTTLAAETGATINKIADGSADMEAVAGIITWLKTGTNEFYVKGDVGAFSS